MGVGPHAGYLLRLYGAHVDQAFGHVAYQVGSSLTEKRGWRDVDVRLVMPDDEFADQFPGIVGSRSRRMHELAWTVLGERMTGLPIDFQIQMQSEANAEFDGPRSALLLHENELPIARSSRG